jgi:hypothetical protein
MQAFFMIERLLRKDPLVKPEDKIVRVILADPQMSIVRGSWTATALRLCEV